ncbi:hypothetical protein [Galbitalea soli]|uniref:Uncharacterized protein n=1 Tax=Galbitalea soli TaxID=1268042 RepID=A0A7C9PMK6_9MICO|nr:hypothetical protein [Galbitalea soli]
MRLHDGGAPITELMKQYGRSRKTIKKHLRTVGPLLETSVLDE